MALEERVLLGIIVLRRGLLVKGFLLILRRDFARSVSHDNMTFYYEGLVDDFDFCGPTEYTEGGLDS